MVDLLVNDLVDRLLMVTWNEFRMAAMKWKELCDGKKRKLILDIRSSLVKLLRTRTNLPSLGGDDGEMDGGSVGDDVTVGLVVGLSVGFLVGLFEGCTEFEGKDEGI